MTHEQIVAELRKTHAETGNWILLAAADIIERLDVDNKELSERLEYLDGIGVERNTLT